MAKFVCDYGSVKEIAGKYASLASEIESSTTSYESNINQDLSTWNGEAKSSFEAMAAEKIATSKAEAAALNELATFIKSAAESIEATDESLASQEI